MSTNDAAAQLASDLGLLQTEANSLESKARFADARSALESFENEVGGLPERVALVRSHGYVFETGLEQQAGDFVGRWGPLRATVEQHIDQETAALQPDLRALELQMSQLNGWSSDVGVAQSLLGQAQSSASGLDARISAVDSTLAGMYESFKGEVQKLTEQLGRVEWMQTQLAEASFQLMPSEGALMAVPAVWCRQGKQAKDDPEGVLLLTDQRLLFEQKQEVATKKMLFIATEKQKVQKLLVDAPIGKSDSVKGTKQGLMGHEDHVDITFVSGMPLRAAHFHLKGQDCNLWQGLIGRAKAGDFDHDRTVLPDAAQVERVKAAPTKCPSCGGAITETVLRGMDSIICGFCGTVIRL
jgi:hypothetical protein